MTEKPGRKIIWLTWEKQVRNRSMSRELGIPLFEILSDKRRIARYTSCIGRTIALLTREKPAVVICQNPSVVLTLLLLWTRRAYGFKVGIDAHFAGIRRNGIVQRILDYCNRNAEFVIVTNEGDAAHIRALRGRPFVCPDPLPELGRYRGAQPEIPQKIFFICSFDKDEPFGQVFDAAAMLAPEGYLFFVSGNYRKRGISKDDFPQVQLLGFVPESEYYGHLFTSQVVIDLTENENCLVCGAYEAMEAGKPLVLSKKKALEEYFDEGTVFTENRASEIAAAIKVAFGKRSRLEEESRRWVNRARQDIREKINMIKLEIQE